MLLNNFNVFVLICVRFVLLIVLFSDHRSMTIVQNFDWNDVFMPVDEVQGAAFREWTAFWIPQSRCPRSTRPRESKPLLRGFMNGLLTFRCTSPPIPSGFRQALRFSAPRRLWRPLSIVKTGVARYTHRAARALTRQQLDGRLPNLHGELS
jgi:hypothetical protein